MTRLFIGDVHVFLIGLYVMSVTGNVPYCYKNSHCHSV